MVTEDELINVLKKTLQDNGQYGRIKADLMNQLMQALGMEKQLIDSDMPQPPVSVSVVNQLILEYLKWTGYKFTETMFLAEASIPTVKTTREELKQKLNVKEPTNSEGLPLLLLILSTMKEAHSNGRN